MKRLVTFAVLTLPLCILIGCGPSGNSNALEGASDQEIAEVRAQIEAEQKAMQAGHEAGQYNAGNETGAAGQ